MTTVPLCWPVNKRCACGRGHGEKEIGKAPLISITSYLTTPPTPEESAGWQRRWPSANVGRLLEPESLLIIDCDSDAARGEAIARGLPPAPVTTSAKGRHYWYRRPADAPATNAIKVGRSKALDILARGYLVVPPSIHRTGVAYEWVVDATVNPVTPAPAWAVAFLHAAISAPPVALAAVLGPVSSIDEMLAPALVTLLRDGAASDPARYPSRSEALWAALHGLIRAGLDDDTIARTILDPAHAVGDKPRELGRRWLAGELGRARAKTQVVVL